VCRRLRQDKVDIPVIMLTARDEEIDRVLGLEIGADDYVTKPFSVRELLARVKAVLRRRAPVPEEVAAPLRVGSLELRPDSFEAFVDGHPVSLTLKEFELLEMLARNRGRVLKRDYLLQALWGFDSSASTRVLDVHISKLREKLGDDSTAPRFIKTVRGVGYRLEESKDVQ
jgi:two-component system alkaline phosphatase synthesis response regulator PhoP